MVSLVIIFRYFPFYVVADLSHAPAGMALFGGRTYIIMTKNDGIVYKRLNKNKKNLLVVESDEPFYSPYEVKASEIKQIWEFKCNLGRKDTKQTNVISGTIEEMFMELKNDIRRLERKI